MTPLRLPALAFSALTCLSALAPAAAADYPTRSMAVSYTHLTLPTILLV